MNLHKKLYGSALTWFHTTLLISVSAVFVTLIVASVCMFIAGQKTDDAINQEILKADSIRNELLKIRVYDMEAADSLTVSPNGLTAIEKRLIRLENQQENTLADIRQESNNIINKFNGWLGFWIAILAIFGGVIPLVIQYVLKQKAEKEYRQMFEEMEKKAYTQYLFQLISSVNVNNECSILKDSVKQGDYIAMTIGESYQALNRLMEHIDKDNGTLSRESELLIVNSLIQYIRLIDILKAISNHRKIRTLEETRALVKTLIEDIFNHEQHNREIIWLRLMDILPRLRGLHYNE